MTITQVLLFIYLFVTLIIETELKAEICIWGSHCLSVSIDMLSLSDINYEVLIQINIVLRTCACVCTVYLLNMCSIKTQVLLWMLFMGLDLIRAMKSFFSTIIISRPLYSPFYRFPQNHILWACFCFSPLGHPKLTFFPDL